MKLIATVLAIALAMPGVCSAANRHDAELALTEARSAVEAAERAGAPEHAIADFNAARDNLARAADRADRRDWSDSMLASERTRADANLAEARSRQHRAELATREVEDALRTLHIELGS